MESIDRFILEEAQHHAPAELDLTNSDHLDAVQSVAESLEACVSHPTELLAAEERISNAADVLLGVRVGLKLATSRLLFREVTAPMHVSVVFAVYKEHLRMLPRDEHPAGEDFVRRKLRQLRWLFESTPQHTWDLTIVDDGCPEGSGRMAQGVLDEAASADEEVRVLFLDEAIREGLPIVRDLDSTDQSRKGGSIRLGLWAATQARREGANHVVLFTDADLSTHLGQIGLLAAPLADPTRVAAVGSRREPSSVVVKAGARNVRGKLFVYLWKRLIPQLHGIIDTQCGFKAFDAEDLSGWIEGTRDNGFSFDVEFLLRVRLDGAGTLTKVPVAWIDSEVASTTTEFEPYLPMLQSIAGLYRNALPSDPRSEPFARLIEQLDSESFRRLVANVPSAIADREPFEFDEYDGVSAYDLAQIVGVDLQAE